MIKPTIAAATLVAVLGATAVPARADQATISGSGFVVSMSTVEPAVAGNPIDVTIVLTPRGEYKVNDEYPISLQVQGPGDVVVPRAPLRRADATVVRHDRAAFTVQVTPKAAGAKALAFGFKFALCTAVTCEPRKETLAFTLRVR